jgi:hypothetical protein
MTAAGLAGEALALLGNEGALESMRRELRLVSEKLSGQDDPMEVAASIVENCWKNAQDEAEKEVVHAR